MPTLDYHTSPPASSFSARSALLLALPFVASGMLVVIVADNGAEEPYGFFNWRDAIVQVCGSAVVALIWIAWLGLAIAFARREKWRRLIVLPVVAWSVLNLWVAYWIGVGYFSEPWNTP